jgi:hypothetical protein
MTPSQITVWPEPIEPVTVMRAKLSEKIRTTLQAADSLDKNLL